MFFITYTLLGLVVIAMAIPVDERGLTWNPHGLEVRGKGNKDVTITDTTLVAIDEQTRGKEEQLIVLIEKKTVIKDNSRKLKDNIRKNHYKNKNRNTNTIIIIVTEIVDIRDSNNKNNRYLQRQIRADNGKDRQNDVVVIVTEVVAITIDSSSGNGNGKYKGGGKGKGGRAAPTGVKKVARGTGVASASVPFLTVAANAPYAPSNLTMLSPSGAPAPAPAGVTQEFDPAAIVEANQALLVSQAS